MILTSTLVRPSGWTGYFGACAYQSVCFVAQDFGARWSSTEPSAHLHISYRGNLRISRYSAFIVLSPYSELALPSSCP